MTTPFLLEPALVLSTAHLPAPLRSLLDAITLHSKRYILQDMGYPPSALTKTLHKVASKYRLTSDWIATLDSCYVLQYNDLPGYVFRVLHGDKPALHTSIPEHLPLSLLTSHLELARQQGATRLRYDADAPIHPSLPTYPDTTNLQELRAHAFQEAVQNYTFPDNIAFSSYGPMQEQTGDLWEQILHINDIAENSSKRCGFHVVFLPASPIVLDSYLNL